MAVFSPLGFLHETAGARELARHILFILHISRRVKLEPSRQQQHHHHTRYQMILLGDVIHHKEHKLNIYMIVEKLPTREILFLLFIVCLC